MFVVYPKAGGVGPETAPILPLMLSTKLLPEMETERVSQLLLSEIFPFRRGPSEYTYSGVTNSASKSEPSASLKYNMNAIRCQRDLGKESDSAWLCLSCSLTLPR